MPHVTLLGMSHELSSFHNEKIICPCCWFKVEWVAGQIQRQKINFEFLEKKLLYPAPWIWIDFAFQSVREKNRRRWVQGVMMTRSEVYWKSQTKGDTYRRAPLSASPLTVASPVRGICLTFSVFNIYLFGGGKIASLLHAKVISERLKTSAPMAYMPFRRGRERLRGYRLNESTILSTSD